MVIFHGYVRLPEGKYSIHGAYMNIWDCLNGRSTEKTHHFLRSICGSFRVSGATVQDKTNPMKEETRREFPNTVCLGVQPSHMAGLYMVSIWIIYG